ncbi:hypothetical protein HanXRQr2_Chr17g0815641 [Helianthus annuus]|uniref:Putative NADH dehydrogenase [ubiquinone] 1 beta subcomplex subunit 2 n=1 Tax=Helianthus annuus TaxID=4232 RepID=A0A251RVI9_HELAN|nr:hypothetical protein HanXRQr2_Chr17g0815641 [Helianthus annuus]KAJ0430016.1 hypothetical protein HanHA300_Chr17g0664101 [Helianthus annuus]KAJ0434744.1 hypothetical protein HanIR_Chr17g0885221 [Helianthus annuus]KAJ0637127.1 hypothetical protein HanOQP8_Chr17g0670111 [Helianthus annuus]KAJ0814241.1 hypothetical protein HanPSC8_Chr17g0783311 [Helianthus annuus]
MAGGHGYGNGTYKGVHLHQPKRWHTVTGKGMCAMMWFWILYRAKQDGPVVLVRMAASLGRAWTWRRTLGAKMIKRDHKTISCFV